jgi:hypothetical protein
MRPRGEASVYPRVVATDKSGFMKQSVCVRLLMVRLMVELRAGSTTNIRLVKWRPWMGTMRTLTRRMRKRRQMWRMKRLIRREMMMVMEGKLGKGVT